MQRRSVISVSYTHLIDLVKEGKADLEKVITNVYPFEDAAKAFADFDKSGGDMLKVVIDFTNIK